MSDEYTTGNPAYAEDLNQLECDADDCTHENHPELLNLFPNCHESEELCVVAYNKEARTILLFCPVCMSIVSEIKVATRG